MWFTELFKAFQEELIDEHQDVFKSLIDNLDFKEQNVLFPTVLISINSWLRKFLLCYVCYQRRMKNILGKLYKN